MRELIDKLENLKLAIFDLDGVIYKGHELISGADEVIQELKELSIKVIYNSNNSTVTRQMYVERLEKMGIPCEIIDFYTSASITAKEITKIKKNANIYVIGDIGIREELKALGHKITKNEKYFDKVDFVIAGLDVKFNYNKLRIAQKCILQGHAEFYATNPDTTLPMPGGLWPGAGVMVNAIQTCTGRRPIKIFGKPEPDGILLALEDFNIKPEDTCIFGDRLDTDIWAGNRAQIKTACVLTGVTNQKMIANLESKKAGGVTYKPELIPDLVLNKLEDIFKPL
ncbi:MAG: HAD-IIA family hydrolase [Promethearchaeota archaeon]